MVYTIEAEPLKKIKLQPENVIEEVIQNIHVILTTTVYECPLYREFGLKINYLDKPEPVTKSLMVADIYDKIQEFEPRAEVKSVTFKDPERPGQIIPVVEVIIIE